MSAECMPPYFSVVGIFDVWRLARDYGMVSFAGYPNF